MPEISKLMSAAWKECSEEDKAPFVQKAKVCAGWAGPVHLPLGCLPSSRPDLSMCPVHLQELKAEAKAAAAAGGSADGEEAAEAKKKKRAAGGGEGPIRKRAKAGTGGLDGGRGGLASRTGRKLRLRSLPADAASCCRWQEGCCRGC